MVYYKVCFEIKKGVLRAKQKYIPKLMVKIGNFSINSPLKELTEKGSEKLLGFALGAKTMQTEREGRRSTELYSFSSEGQT